MLFKAMFMFFLSLALGYIMCVIAKKQTSVLKTVGYTLGISMIVLTFLFALSVTQGYYSGKGPGCMPGCKAIKCMPMVKHHR